MQSNISKNDILNAVLALLRDDVPTARDILRRDSSLNIPVVTAKIYTAVDGLKAKAASELLIELMKRTMRLESSSSDNANSYLKGVIAVEQIANEMVKELNSKGLYAVGVQESS